MNTQAIRVTAATTLRFLALAALLGVACKEVGTETLQALQGEWTTTSDGVEEKVWFHEEQVVWNHKTDKSYECPYRIESYNENEKTVNIRIRCEKRTGADTWVVYHLKFREDRKAFTIQLSGRTLGSFVAVPAS